MRWSQKERGEFLIRFSMLLSKGYSMKEATTLIAHTYPIRIRKPLLEAFATLENGESLSVIFDSLQFSKDVVSHITFSERHGKIVLGSQSAGEWLLRKVAFRDQLMQQLKYPIFLIWATLLLSFFMMTFLIPQFQQLYSSLDIEFPLITTLFLSVVNIIPYVVLLIVILCIFAYVYYRFSFQKEVPEKKLNLLLRLPFFSTFFRLFCTHTFSLHFGSLLKSGLSIYESISCFAEDAKIDVLRYEGEEIKRLLLLGFSLEQSLEQRILFTEELTRIVNHGSLTGYLDQELVHFSEMILNLLDKKMKRFLEVFQPIVFLCVGLMMFFMFIALFMPMFHMMEEI
ncbi:MAG TPA: competence type IV pilus assembly protein ComGB [Massilibacterium sp.]|nr:competence type IV pilus assembly protein ComGB [Massilibacterium sp.]